MKRSIPTVLLGSALAVALAGCAAPDEGRGACPEGFVTWMSGTGTYGLDLVEHADHAEASTFLPEHVEATCAFATTDADRSAVAIITASTVDGQAALDDVRAHLSSMPELTRATNGNTTFAFTSDDGTIVAAELRPEQFLTDIGETEAGSTMVIVSVDRR